MFGGKALPKCYTYARASDESQVIADNSIPHQNKRTYPFYQQHIAPKGVEFGGAVEDPAVSAYKVPFDKRPGGKLLIERLRPGDHVVFDKVDRVWRSLKDFLRLVEWFNARQITVHFVDMQGMSISTDSPMGRFTLQLLVMVAELESGIKSERNRISAHMRRSEGRPVGHAPIGMKIVKVRTKSGTRKVLQWDEDALGTMAEIERLRDEEGMGWEAMGEHLSEQCGLKAGQAWKKTWVFGRPFTAEICRAWYHRWKQYKQLRENGITDETAVSEEVKRQAEEAKKRKFLRKAQMAGIDLP